MSYPVKQLRICIIGAGMGGLTCALALAQRGFQDIRVFEAASDLGFVGAGIQLAPNMARILDQLGVWQNIKAEAVVVKSASVRQAESDQELGRVNFDQIEQTYGYPHMVGHRASLAGALFKGCQREPAITFHFSTRVHDIQSFSKHPKLVVQHRDAADSRKIEADIVLAADGIKSQSRAQLLGLLQLEDAVQDTGHAAYRIMLKREQMQHDPELMALIDTDGVTRWVGARRHIIAYPIHGKQIYNLSTSQMDTTFASAPSATYTTTGSKKDMLDEYSTFCPIVRKMLSLVPDEEVCIWKLRTHAPLPMWSYGSVALLGDTCHPMQPHLGQGAAQAIEDAAVLAVALAHMPDGSADSIMHAFQIYQQVRKDRAENLVNLSAANGRTLHLEEGEAREERDRAFAALQNGKGVVPDKFANADIQRLVYGFDCVKVAEELLRSKPKPMVRARL